MKHYVAKVDIVEAWQFVEPKFAVDQQRLDDFCDESGLGITKDSNGRWLVGSFLYFLVCSFSYMV